MGTYSALPRAQYRQQPRRMPRTLGFERYALSFNGSTNYCFSEDTEVLTHAGWKRISEVRYEDKIATLNPETDELEYQHPSRLFNFEYSGKMCHFYGRHLDLLVTPDHNVYVSRYKSGADWHSYQLEKAEDVLTSFIKFKKECKWNGEKREYFILPAIEENHRVGYSPQPERKIPMNLWLRFFGWWLAEGCIRERKNPKTQSTYYQIIISQSKLNTENCKEIEKTVDALGWTWSYHQHNYYIWSGYNKQLVQYLKQFGKAEDKYIPKEFKKLPVSQLEILYSALMKGDGSGNVFYTKSKQLADDVQEVCLKLGYSADVSFLQNRKYPIYAVRIGKTNTRPRINEPRNSRKIYGKGEWSDYNGRVYGVTVPQHHIIYVRRNGKACWAGNCDCGNDSSLNLTDEITIEAWIYNPADYTPGEGNHGILGNNVYDIHYYDSGSHRMLYFMDRSDQLTDDRISTSLDKEGWYYITFTYDGSYLRWFVNGELKTSNPSSGTMDGTIAKNLKIGASYLYPPHFNGLIDEVRIYNRALSEEEIRWNMLNYHNPVHPEHLVLWLPMEEGSGLTVYDKSGYGNNGTLLPADDPPTWTRVRQFELRASV